MTAVNSALRPIYRTVFATAVLWGSGLSVAHSAPVEFACGTAGQGGSFFSETGQQVCETKGGPSVSTTLTQDSKAIFCF
jgi:hypothetical protein